MTMGRSYPSAMPSRHERYLRGADGRSRRKPAVREKCERRLRQEVLSSHAVVYNTFMVQRHLTLAETRRALRAVAMTTWRTAVAAA